MWKVIWFIMNDDKYEIRREIQTFNCSKDSGTMKMEHRLSYRKSSPGPSSFWSSRRIDGRCKALKTIRSSTCGSTLGPTNTSSLKFWLPTTKISIYSFFPAKIVNCYHIMHLRRWILFAQSIILPSKPSLDWEIPAGGCSLRFLRGIRQFLEAAEAQDFGEQLLQYPRGMTNSTCKPNNLDDLSGMLQWYQQIETLKRWTK